MSGKEKKILAQAITLGLLLALPLGAQAKDYNKYRVQGQSDTYSSVMDDDRKIVKVTDDSNSTVIYNFKSNDVLSFTSSDLSNVAAVYFTAAANPDSYKIDLGNLGRIECTADIANNSNVNGVYGVLSFVDNLDVTLRDCSIDVTGNSYYVRGFNIDSNRSATAGTVINCGKVEISASSTAELGHVDGVCVNYGSSVVLGNDSIIASSGNTKGFLQTWGVAAQFYAQRIELKDRIKINTFLNYNGDGEIDYPDYPIGVPRKSNGESVGIYADSGNFIVGDYLNIESIGSGSGSIWVRGINAQTNLSYQILPTVNIGDYTTINVTNQAIAGAAQGMYINAGSVSIGENSTIISKAIIGDSVKPDSKNGIQVRGIHIDTSNNELVSEEEAKTIIAIVELGDGAKIQAINNVKGGETTGVYAHDNVIFNGSSQIVAQAGDQGKHDSYGIYATSEKGKVDLGAASAISVINNSSDSAAYTACIKAVDNSKVTMRGGSITGKSADGKNFKAIVTSDAAQVNVNEDGARNIIVEGDLEASTQSAITLSANQPQSYLIGAVTTDYAENVDENTNTKTDLTFKNTTWYMTGDSNVTNLTLDNGVVSMVENANDMGTVKGNAHKLSIDKALNGSGAFIMDLTYHDNNVKSYEEATDSDFVYIHGGDNSEQRLVFKDNNSNLGAMASDDKLYFAQIKQDAATFGEGGANVGEYNTVTAVNEKGIYDLEFYIDSEQSEQADYNDWFITGKTKKANPNGDSPIHSYNAGFALWRDDDTLLKRLGELRFTNDEGGAWARVIGKKLEDKCSLGFNTHAKTVQVGYDRKDVQEDGSGTWRKGIALGHTWADTSFRSGKGKNNYTDLTLYATNIRKHDHYWDLVARIGYIDSEYDTAYGDHGEFDNWAGSLSAEYGRKKKFNEDNWFIEPQAQLTYSYMWGDTYTTRNGAKVVQSNADSLVGRAGFVISKEIESERKYPHRYYAKAFIMHEFLDGGDNNIYFGSDRLYGGSDFKDTWYVAGVGANVDMGNSCTFYFDAERNFKAHVKMPYRIEAGFRWEF